jgi:hypothetical protein
MEQTCEVCGTSFSGRRGALTCGPACRQARARRRRADVDPPAGPVAAGLARVVDDWFVDIGADAVPAPVATSLRMLAAEIDRRPGSVGLWNTFVGLVREVVTDVERAPDPFDELLREIG